jgi:hypothetical protein
MEYRQSCSADETPLVAKRAGMSPGSRARDLRGGRVDSSLPTPPVVTGFAARVYGSTVRLLIGAVIVILAAACARTVPPSPSATTAGRILGTFATDRAVLGPCVAIRVAADALQTGAGNAWWWDQGSSGDCSTRTSDVVSATARLASAGAMTEPTLSIPAMDGTSEDMTFALKPSTDGLTGTVTTKTATSAVRFVPIARVDPTLQPVP